VTDAGRGTEVTLDIDPIDAAMMSRCVELSRIGAAAGELPFGSLIARRGQIIAESTNEIVRLTDESRHAEIIAIARARNLIGDDALSECTLYSTVEPCPMCAFCIRSAGLGRVAYALGSPVLGGLSRWNILGDDRRFLFGRVPELLPGLLADEAHRVWIELRPITGRAVVLAGFLSKPKMKTPGSVSPRSRYRFSLRRLISLFPRRHKPRPAADPLPDSAGKALRHDTDATAALAKLGEFSRTLD
jgi:tRNA(adenine34) deaminase